MKFSKWYKRKLYRKIIIFSKEYFVSEFRNVPLKSWFLWFTFHRAPSFYWWSELKLQIVGLFPKVYLHFFHIFHIVYNNMLLVFLFQTQEKIFLDKLSSFKSLENPSFSSSTKIKTKDFVFFLWAHWFYPDYGCNRLNKNIITYHKWS